MCSSIDCPKTYKYTKQSKLQKVIEDMIEYVLPVFVCAFVPISIWVLIYYLVCS